MGEAFVVAEVEVGFSAVVGDKDFAVLEGAHGAGVDVEVGVEFLHGDAEATAFKQTANRRGGDAFSERRDYAAGHKNVLSHFEEDSPER